MVALVRLIWFIRWRDVVRFDCVARVGWSNSLSHLSHCVLAGWHMEPGACGSYMPETTFLACSTLLGLVDLACVAIARRFAQRALFAFDSSEFLMGFAVHHFPVFFSRWQLGRLGVGLINQSGSVPSFAWMHDLGRWVEIGVCAAKDCASARLFDSGVRHPSLSFWYRSSPVYDGCRWTIGIPRITHPEYLICIQFTIPWSVCRESTYSSW
jgi:hypothetical protein